MQEAVFRVVTYVSEIPEKGLFFLAGDIGGTNSNFGVLDIQHEKEPKLIISLHVKSQTVVDYTDIAAQLHDYLQGRFGLKLYKACIGVAGVVSPDRTFAKPTNLDISLDGKRMQKALQVKDLLFINDFEAVAMGVEYLPQEHIVVINKGGVERVHANKAFIGAGTGLGKAAAVWSRSLKHYIPLASEGGHADCSAQTTQEFALIEFINQERQQKCPVSWEDLLSGNGIKRIYRFLATQKQYQETSVTKEIAASDFDPDKISKYAKTDERCKDTFTMYARFYARCAKNFALDVLSLNGIYIAGGIAAKNISLFKNSLFMEEFTKCGKQSLILQKMPVYVIADYNVSLYGAWGFARYYKEE